MNNSKNLLKAKAVLRGAICGDIIGSYYEFRSTKDYNFPLQTKYSRFTDDTVCSIAVAASLVSNEPLTTVMQKWCRNYPLAGFGGMFRTWINSDSPKAYGSFGNGSAMRVSPVGSVAVTKEECLDLAKKSAIITHNHPEGIKGAQAVALAIFMGLEGASKDDIVKELEKRFEYDLTRDYSEIQA